MAPRGRRIAYLHRSLYFPISGGAPTHAGWKVQAPRRIYVAFGEHPAAGVCVCVCSLKLDSSGLVVRVFVCVHVCVGVCSFVSLFADSRLSLFPWLVGCLGVWSVCACVFFGTCGPFSWFVSALGNLFVFFLHFGGPWNSIVTLGAPLCHPCWTILQVFCNW